jgi:hypothetical protein
VVRGDRLDRRREDIVEPNLPIVGPHHYLWDHPETGRCLLPELLPNLGYGRNITATVFVQCGSTLRPSCAGESQR